MKKFFSLFGALRSIAIIALVFVIGFSMITCGNDGGDSGDGGDTGSEGKDVPPEEMPVKDRWYSWWDDTSKAKIEYSVGNDGVCTVNVIGEADALWKATVNYKYTQKEKTSYIYQFEAWTESDERKLIVTYFPSFYEVINITSTRTTYIIEGDVLPTLGDGSSLNFSCGDKLGTLYIKVLSIKEYTPTPGIKITVTDIPSLIVNNYGFVNLYKDKSSTIIIGSSYPEKVSGDKLMLDMLDDKKFIFTKEGTYFVELVLTSDKDGNEQVYLGYIENKKIEVSTTISFIDFNTD